MKIFLAKQFFRVGDLIYNYNKIIDIYNQSIKEGCDLLIFSEMAITGFPCYELLQNRDFIDNTNNYIEKLVDYTQGKKTRILLGCPYFVEESNKNGIIEKSQLYNSAILISDGYIDGISSKTTISKNNILDEYKYFDTEFVLKSISYENDNFDILIGDDIQNNKNILFLKERDTDFILSLDSSLQTQICLQEKQLSKIAKWTHKPIIYINNFSYDINKCYQFNGNIMIYTSDGKNIYNNHIIQEDIIKINIGTKEGQTCINVLNKKKKSNDLFINIFARNYENYKIIYEITKDNLHKYHNNVKLITFNDKLNNTNIEYIDYHKYIKDLPLTSTIKKEIVNYLFSDYILFQ